jgi:cyclophilin family peptidyl-prolyl cis-trans isomerase
MKLKNLLLITIIIFVAVNCTSRNPLINPANDDLAVQAPAVFKVEFNTTKGNFIVEAKREYSPLAVDRFFYLINNNYYNNNKFFRVLPNFVVQWGMKGVPEIDSVWSDLGVADEPVKLSNNKGTIAFARGGPQTRSNQLFINLADNLQLDESNFNEVTGFPAFGKVVNGMDVVETINAEYLQNPNQDSISIQGNKYLDRAYPNLDYIISAKIATEK